ncbi:unnamed protein product [Caenorhabditis sp. 36 PRJEB53466]|nr:unnamed protein product [Caenorhabditis sp. 36 PRJEB53466]
MRTTGGREEAQKRKKGKRHPQRKLPEKKVSFTTRAVIAMKEDVTTESIEGSKVFAKPHFDTAKLALRILNRTDWD